MQSLLVLGAGGHAKVVADVARLQGHDVVAFVDEMSWPTPRSLGGIPVVSSLEERPGYPVALGIGDNRARLSRYTSLQRSGRPVASLKHPSAVVGPGVSVGEGTVLMAGTVVNSDSRLGSAVLLNTSCSVDHDAVIEHGVHVAPGARLAGSVSVGTGAFIGMGACILPGRRIGAWSICGAGAVVVNDVAEGATVKGIPAR